MSEPHWHCAQTRYCCCLTDAHDCMPWPRSSPSCTKSRVAAVCLCFLWPALHLQPVKQGEGCEQGDPLAPALFAQRQHDALHCGIGYKLGETRAIGVCKGHCHQVSRSEMWRGDLRSHHRGIVVLGTQVGHPHFVQTWATQRLEEEERLLRQLSKLPDLQCSWGSVLFPVRTTPYARRTVPQQEIPCLRSGP